MNNIIRISVLFISVLVYSQNKNNHYPIIEWQKKVGDTISGQAKCIRQTFNGGYVVVGSGYVVTDETNDNKYGFEDIYVVKLNHSGIVEWQKKLGGNQNDYANSIEQTTDGGYIIAGKTNSNNGDVVNKKEENGYDYWIIKLDKNGNLQWQKIFGGDSFDEANDVKQTSDGGYIVAGTSRSNFTNKERKILDGFNTKNWILKLDREGNIEWQNVFGGSGYEYSINIYQSNDKGYIIGGYINESTITSQSNYDFTLIKLNDKGVVQWQKKYGGTNDEVLFSLQQTQDGGYIMAGSTNSIDGDVTNVKGGGIDFWVVKLNADGEIIWQKAIGETADDYITSIQETPDGGYIMVGSVGIFNKNGIVLKLDKNGVLVWKKRMGGTENDMFFSIQATKDNEYILAGYSYSSDEDLENIKSEGCFWIVKLSLPENTKNKQK